MTIMDVLNVRYLKPELLEPKFLDVSGFGGWLLRNVVG